jgi:acyl-coenzyme A synthetase/AMP-(fatty) acid ligase
MHDTPLIGPYRPDDVMAWRQGRTYTARQFLADVTALAEVLPDRPAVLNLADSRYAFLVGFAAAILRGQLTLLPQRRAPEALRRLAGDYPGSYVLTDHDDRIEGLDAVPILSNGGHAPWPKHIPLVPLTQVVAIAFTSGSTGHPVPNQKTWGALTGVAQATGARLGIKEGDRIGVVATVPHQHMFGLEASVMLPLMHGVAMYAGRPLFPADIGSVLADVAGRWMLVTTPLHLRACVAERLHVPPRGLILSATAPLGRSVAQEAERMFQSEVHEIFGFAEAGSVAERRTIDGDRWTPLEGVRVIQDQRSCTVQAWYLPQPVPVPDRVTVESGGAFFLYGREADQVNVAGHRVSLGDLNQTLLRIDGVQDGIFFLPEEEAGLVTRLMAFVVAPGKTSDEIQCALRAHLDPVFLPRPLVCVPSLPRNATGKLPREAVLELSRQWVGKASHGV